MHLMAALLIPLAAGGAFCGVLLSHGIYGLLPAAMLVFYGLALLNAGNFTFGEVRYLGAPAALPLFRKVGTVLGETAPRRPSRT